MIFFFSNVIFFLILLKLGLARFLYDGIEPYKFQLNRRRLFGHFFFNLSQSRGAVVVSKDFRFGAKKVVGMN